MVESFESWVTSNDITSATGTFVDNSPLKSPDPAMCQPLSLQEWQNLMNDLLTGSLSSGGSTNTPMSTASTAKKPSASTKFPITHPLYKKINSTGDFVAGLGISRLNLSHLLDEATSFGEHIMKDGVEVFMARLSDARHRSANPWSHPSWVIEGHAYDPWWRDISFYKNAHFSKSNSINLHTRVSANYAESTLVWVYKTTLESQPVKIVLHEPARISYCNSRRTQQHHDSIEAYSVKTDSNYDLMI